MPPVADHEGPGRAAEMPLRLRDRCPCRQENRRKIGRCPWSAAEIRQGACRASSVPPGVHRRPILGPGRQGDRGRGRVLAFPSYSGHSWPPACLCPPGRRPARSRPRGESEESRSTGEARSVPAAPAVCAARPPHCFLWGPALVRDCPDGRRPERSRRPRMARPLARRPSITVAIVSVLPVAAPK